MSPSPFRLLTPLFRPSALASCSKPPTLARIASQPHNHTRLFSTTPSPPATLMQVLRGCRVPQRARKPVSPAMVNRPQMKGVCLKVGITKPKKPNSGERKTARVRLSSGRTITAYISGEGQWSVVFEWKRGRDGRDCVGGWIAAAAEIGRTKSRWVWAGGLDRERLLEGEETGTICGEREG
ncbi:hypothetical protein MMC27_002752 [Xylographa pallens]|nr:hypothetical protein [Xylographa pallens]